ncbi:MAG TPA: site-specific DNA-methyltransferase, partial [bacterium]|nr:site-specific DNA-methyltransferase [bacterium]
FFSVYTLPPNQAVSQKSQQKINEKKNQKPEYRNVKNIILKKADQLLSGLNFHNLNLINKFNAKSKFFTEDAKSIPQIESNSVKLTVTSPPFLDIVQYSKDNWLRCWFNNIEETEISKKITMSKTINEWNEVMKNVFDELFRITKLWGWVAFEVGEIRKGKIKLEEEILKIGIDSGFKLFGVIINSQKFTKTANIWGINNNEEGTNTNRIVLFYKGE